MRRALVLLLLAGCGDGGGRPDATVDASPDAPGRPDAALAPCGIEEPGSRCAGRVTLERCEGTAVATVTCDAGQVCSREPATGRGAACISPTTACGAIDELGVCSGPIFTVCRDGVLRVNDCGEIFGECFTIEPSGVSQCATACTRAFVAAEGFCQPDAGLRHCVFSGGTYQVVTEACPAGTLCQRSGPETFLPGCVPTPDCGEVGRYGKCDGDLLLTCGSAGVTTTDCAARGEVCVFGGEASGHVCAPRAGSGARRVSGAIVYDDREARVGSYGPPVATPVRGAAVVVVDEASGRTVAAGASDDAGRYQLRFDAAGPAHVLVIAAGTTRERPVRVMRSDGLLHGFASASFTAADATVDLHVREADGAGAFNIFDELVSGMDVIRVLFATSTPPALVAVWSKGGNVQTGVAGLLMRLIGSVADDDGYDDGVIVHELGHFVENVFGRTDNLGGGHMIRKPSPPPQAWSEGFASYFSSLVRDDPTYVDNNAAGIVRFNLETDVTLADPGLDQTQQLPETTVGEILWDLGDARAGDDDPASGPHAASVRVEELYLRNLALGRGAPGVDLVDFLDGLLFLDGGGRCAEVRAVVASRSFPYDFAGPVGCPP